MSEVFLPISGSTLFQWALCLINMVSISNLRCVQVISSVYLPNDIGVEILQVSTRSWTCYYCSKNKIKETKTYRHASLHHRNLFTFHV